MLLRTVTLGCKVNQYETEYLREGLARLGYRDAQAGQRADLCLVNTCSVTVEGEAKSRKLIRHLARHNPGAEIIVMGCYASRSPAEVAGLAGVAEVIADKRQLPEWLARRGLLDVPEGISTFGRRHRAYVKIQDGCRAGCSYCIIPRVRPVLWSRPAGEVLAEIGRLVANGHREIVLTGIHLGHYGRDRPDGWNLARLVRQIAGLEGEFRLRLSSLEAGEATGELIAAMAGACRADLPPFAHPLAERVGCRVAADGPAVARRAVGSPLPPDPVRPGPAGPDHRRDGRLSGRDGGGFRRYLPGRGGGGLLEAARLPLQCPARHAGRTHDGPRAGRGAAAAGR